MSFNSRDQHGWPDDHATYPGRPPSPPYPRHPPHPSHPPRPPRPYQPPRPAHRPPPAHPPSVPARQDSELVRLRTAYRWLRRSMTLTVLAYFIGYLCMAAYLPGLMGTAFIGTLNFGVFLGLLVIPLSIVSVVVYELIARSTVDPAAHRVRIADAEQREREEHR